MPFDSEVALVGTGLAPLVAAAELISHGITPLVLNPDFDFFLEDSELPLDPMLVRKPTRDRLTKSLPEHAIAALRPGFPGAVESWPAKDPQGFHDSQAPYIRQRARLWIAESGRAEKAPARIWDLDALDELYVEASDAGLHPQTFEGIPAARRFPGFVKGAPEGSRECKGLLLPKACDVDVQRYRAGLLEFVTERLGTERVVRSAGQIDLIPEGVRFHAGGAPQTARISRSVLVFWTPRLTQWVSAQAKKLEVKLGRPSGVRLWEQWSLISREPLETDVIGMFQDVVAWADVEGAPPVNASANPSRLSALRSGALVDMRELQTLGASSSTGNGALRWASGDSFATLEALFREFLGWEYYSVRAMKPRAIFEWIEANGPHAWKLRARGTSAADSPEVEVIGACDGPIADVVGNVRKACERFA
jgi:hypothetical protein